MNSSCIIPPKQCVFIKTHVWNEELEEYIRWFYKCCKKINIDFYLLVQDNIKTKIPQDYLFLVKFYSIDIIANFYKSGFYEIWLSNHIICQWFYQNFGKQYDYIWSVSMF